MKLNENINNIQPKEILKGLSKEEVDKRIKEGNYNKNIDSVSKTTKENIVLQGIIQNRTQSQQHSYLTDGHIHGIEPKAKAEKIA